MSRRLGGLPAAILMWTGMASFAGHLKLVVVTAETPPVKIDLARGTQREQQGKRTLEQVLAAYDLKKYTFTRRVVIEEGAVNHAFPVLTLNARFASSPDELLASYIHEQYLRFRAEGTCEYAGSAHTAAARRSGAGDHAGAARDTNAHCAAAEGQ